MFAFSGPKKKKKNFKMKFLAIVSFDLLWVFVFSLAINYYCLSHTLSLSLCHNNQGEKGVVDSKEQKRKKQK